MSTRWNITLVGESMPPIISNEKDRNFLTQLNAFIETELGKIDTDDEEQRYIIYKSAFDKIIDYVGAYKPLLTAIKAEYEDVIETIQRGQREAFYLSGKLKAVASGPSTLRNYRKRADELESNMSVIRSDNEQLRKQIETLRKTREERERKSKEIPEAPKKITRKNKRPIPDDITSCLLEGIQLKVKDAYIAQGGFTLQQSTDPRTLNKELDKLDRQLKELSLAFRTRYLPKDVKANLKDHLASKVVLRDQLAEKTDILKYKGQKLKVAVEAAQAYMKIQPPHQTVGDAVVNALHRANSQGVWQKDDGTASIFEEDDPAKEKEAEIMLEYIEKFTELMEDEKYEEAAVHAANSPKGILRTVETMQKFQEVEVKTNKGRSALLAFCEALIATVPAYGVKPNEFISLEAVQCALNENRHDLLAHWVTQDRLTLSDVMGDLIWHYTEQKPKTGVHCLAWAQHVYSSVGLHYPAIKCMIIQGKLKQAIQYAQHGANFSVKEFTALLKEHPSEELSRELLSYEVDGSRLVPVGVVATVLLGSGNESLAVQLLEIMCKDPVSGQLDRTKLRSEVFGDSHTTPDQLVKLAKMCDKYDHKEAGMELVAASIVLKALFGASQRVSNSTSVLREESKATTKKPTRLRFASETESESEDDY